MSAIDDVLASFDIDDLAALTKEDCPTCVTRRDEHGRMPIGLCGPECLMVKKRELLQRHRENIAAQIARAPGSYPRCQLFGCTKEAVRDGRCRRHQR